MSPKPPMTPTPSMRSPAPRPAPPRLALALVLAGVLGGALSGCSFGFGSAFVGQWSPRRQVEFNACLREPGPPGAPECKEQKQITSDVPGRRFWGVITPFIQLGASKATFRDETATLFRAHISIEVLRGRGRWAYGVRTGGIFENNGEESGVGSSITTWDVGGLVHYHLVNRLSAYGGLSYFPLTRMGTMTDGTNTSLGGRGLVGAQLALSKTHSESYIVLSLELDQMFLRFDDETYRSTGLTGHIGLFF